MPMIDEALVYLKEKLKAFPRFPLALLPTPCHLLGSLSKSYGQEIFCKREDLSGFGFGGNKSRKLEFLVGEAIEHGCDTLVTSGGLQSNFCRLTAAAGAAAGMNVHLVLGGERPKRAIGNIILDKMLGAQIHWVESTEWDAWEAESDRVARILTEEGACVFRLPIGGSVPVGVAGYVSAFFEVLEEERRLGEPFDRIIHASGSGGTQAGLVVGKDLAGWPGKITGISVSLDREALQEKIVTLASQAAALLGGRINPESVSVSDDFVGSGYAVNTVAGERAIDYFAKREAIFLDHVYTGKAASALMAWLESGKLKGERILFIHTGGQPQLFAEDESL